METKKRVDRKWIEVLYSCVENYECLKKYLESNKEMNELYHTIMLDFFSNVEVSLDDAEAIFEFFAECPYATPGKDEISEYIKIDCSKKWETPEAELYEKLYVWDSATDEHIEILQKTEYKGNELKP